MNNTSIGKHTISIFRNLKGTEYKKLSNDFKKYLKNNEDFKGYRNEKCSGYVWEYYYLKNKGIRWRLSSKTESNGYISRKIEAIINPKVLCDNNYITAATESDLLQTEELFNEEAENISPYLLTFSDYSLNRVDYCMNVDLTELGYPCTPQQMLKLIKQGNIPEFFEEQGFYSNTGHRVTKFMNSFYLVNSSVTLNYYLKYPQQTENHPNYVNRDDSENVIRLEVQCKRKKLQEMFDAQYSSDEYDTYSNQKGSVPIYPMLQNKISENIVNDYLKKVVRKGHYFTIDGATQIIKSYKFKDKKQDRLLDTIELVKEHGGISKAKLSLLNSNAKEEYEKKLREFNKALRELDDLLINPVTIPRRWNIKWMPNIMFAYACAAYDEIFLGVREHEAMDCINRYLHK